MLTDQVFDYLRDNYRENEPIFLSDIRITNMKNVSVRQQIRKLAIDGRIKRFDAGIYYIPKKTMFKSGSVLSVDEIVRKKYLMDGEGKSGYFCGVMFANRLGLTTQVPMLYEVCSNRAKTEYRNTKIGNFQLIIRKPYVAINDSNVDKLQFLDMMMEVMDISEIEGRDLKNRLLNYLRAKGILLESLRPYMIFYPAKIYTNMYEVGLLNGMVA